MSKNQEIAVTYQVDGIEVKLTPSIVQNYLVGSSAQITMAEFKFFTELCKARGLNPFLKEAYLIKFGNEPAQLVVGKEAIERRAILHPQYDGMDSGIIVINDDGVLTERQGLFYTDNEKVAGGWARVYRKDWTHPVYISVSVKESIQRKKGGEPNRMWDSKTATMIEKVASVRALRKAFVEKLGGMYDADEMGVRLPDDMAVEEPEADIIIEESNQDTDPEQVSMDDI